MRVIFNATKLSSWKLLKFIYAFFYYHALRLCVLSLFVRVRAYLSKAARPHYVTVSALRLGYRVMVRIELGLG